MARPRDVIRIETEEGTFDRFASVSVVNDLLAPSEAIVEFGNVGSYTKLRSVIAHGRSVRVTCNDRLRLTGRIEAQEIPTSHDRGSTVTLAVRTLMGDGRVASADPKTRVQKATLEAFVLELYAPLGIDRRDFIFFANLDRDLMTGKVGGRGKPADLEDIKEEAAKVNPPETIFDAAARHLKRHHLMHWDGADGSIVVGVPDEDQGVSYRLQLKTGASSSQGNNILSCRKIADWGEVPSEIWTFGGTAGKDVTRAPFRGRAVDAEVTAAGFYRPVLIPAEGAKSFVQAASQAQRELSTRLRRKDLWEIIVDGWTYWTGDAAFPYATNAIADVDVDTVGGPQGRYLISKVDMKIDPEGAATTVLTAMGPGVWKL